MLSFERYKNLTLNIHIEAIAIISVDVSYAKLALGSKHSSLRYILSAIRIASSLAVQSYDAWLRVKKNIYEFPNPLG